MIFASGSDCQSLVTAPRPLIFLNLQPCFVGDTSSTLARLFEIFSRKPALSPRKKRCQMKNRMWNQKVKRDFQVEKWYEDGFLPWKNGQKWLSVQRWTVTFDGDEVRSLNILHDFPNVSLVWGAHVWTVNHYVLVILHSIQGTFRYW